MSEFVTVGRDGYGFSLAGKAFVPFGCNYFDQHTGWPPKIWSQYSHERVARQLGQMAQAGLNCIRVFIDVSTLHPAAGEYSQAGFAKLDDMLGIARQAGIRIIFSGPNSWETHDHPLRGDMFADQAVLDGRCRLWQQIIGRYGQDPAVMTWDLFNEPQVGWWSLANEHRRPVMQARMEAWKRFAAEQGVAAGDDLPQSSGAGVSKETYGAFVKFLEHLAERWVARQVETIRSAGAKQLISVGLIQWSVPAALVPARGYAGFDPAKVAKYLDYMSVHFYPMPPAGRTLEDPAELDRQTMYCSAVVRGAYIPGKPLMMEEFGWKGGKKVPGDDRAFPLEHQVLWGERLMAATAGCCSGWLNWPYADAASERADVSAASGLWTEDEAIKPWGERFCQYARQLAKKPSTFAPAKTRVELDRVDWLYKHAGHPRVDALAELFPGAKSDSVEVAFR